MEQKPDKGQSPLCWDSRIELKWIDFLKNDKELKRDSGILQHKTAIAFIRKFATIPREDIKAADTQAALLDAIEQYGKNNEKAFTRLKDCIESYSKILLVNSRLLTASDYNYERRITSIGKANNQWSEALEQRGFVPEEDKRLLRRLLKDGEDWRNDWHHKTPPQTDTEKLAEGCKVWLRYIFAVAAISFHYNKSRGGLIFTADRDCQLTFTQPEANPGKQSTFNTLKGVPFQIDARPGGFHLEITVTEANGRSRMETRTGEIKRDEYLKINIRVGELGRGGVPRFAANPLLAGMAKPANEEGIPFQGGTYRGQTNERKLPHGIGTFIRNGISYGGRFREGKPEGSFLVKGEGFEYRGTLSFDTMPWGLDRGEMILTLANRQRYTYKEATFRGLHCVRGCLLLDGKLLYKGVFAPPAEGMLSVPQGNGELHSPDGSIYYGEIDNVVPHGRGCLVSNSGTEAIYTDWIAGESTESTDTMRKILLRGDRPAWLFDGDRIVCPVSGAPLTFYYIGSPRLTLRDESGATLTCPDTEEWNYRFGSPTAQPEPKPKPTAEPEKRTNPTAQPQPANNRGKQELILKKGQNGWFGFADRQGNWIVKPQFDAVDSFSDGLACVRKNWKYGFINEQGHIVIPLKFDFAFSFYNGKNKVQLNGEWFYIDKQGNRISEWEETRQPANEKKEQELARKEGENGKYGYVDEQGHWVIQARFENAWSFTEGLAAVKTNGKYGFINKRGDFVIAPRFDYALEFGYGLAPVMMNDKWGFINQQGRIVIPIKYDDADPFIQGKAEVEQNGETFYIDKQGNRMGEPAQPAKVETKPNTIPAHILKECVFNDTGFAIARLNGKEGHVNRRGEIVVPIIYDKVWDFDPNRFATVKLNEKKGFVNEQGQVVVPILYDTVWAFQENGLAAVRLNEKKGFVNEQGQVVVPIIYDDVWAFEDCGLAQVKLNGKYGFVNTKGQVIVPILYDETWAFEDCGLAKVKLNGKVGFVNTKGQVVVSIIYDEAWAFYCGLAHVKLNGKNGYVNTKGQVIVPVQYSEREALKRKLNL